MDLQAIEIGKKALDSGQNISEALRHLGAKVGNTEEIIEIAYELQAGSYVEFAESHGEQLKIFAEEYAELLQPYLTDESVLLDVGAGELTTLSFVLDKLSVSPSQVIGADISWSRLKIGLDFAKGYFEEDPPNLRVISCEMGSLPFSSKSMDVTISNHALEPNGVDAASLVEELFRVTKHRLVLFEPYYEGSSQKVKNRMELHGYFKGIEKIVEDLGGKIEKIIPLKNSVNKLNPTHCFVITPAAEKERLKSDSSSLVEDNLTVPGTDSRILLREGFYHSPAFGLCFPILEGIPILRNKSSIFASSMKG